VNDGRYDDDRVPKDVIPGRDDGDRDDAVPEDVVPSQPYPGVQGGVPFHHDQDGDVEDDPLLLRLDPDLPTPELRPATLGDADGHGLLMVVRDADGGLVEAEGSWRPDDSEMSLDAVSDAFPEGSTTTFHGARIEGRDEATAEDVQLEVVVRRVAEYAYDDGTRHAVVNFVPSDMR